MEHRKRTFLGFSQRENAALPAVLDRDSQIATRSSEMFSDVRYLHVSGGNFTLSNIIMPDIEPTVTAPSRSWFT